MDPLFIDAMGWAMLHDENEGPKENAYLYLKYTLIGLAAISLFFVSLVVESIFIANAENTFSWIRSPQTYVSLCHDLAFALVIALVISIGIEGFARSQHNRLVKRQMNDLKRDVLRESLGVIVSRSIFEEVKDLVLLSPFERSDHRSEYHLKLINHNGSQNVCFVMSPHHIKLRTEQTCPNRFQLSAI